MTKHSKYLIFTLFICIFLGGCTHRHPRITVEQVLEWNPALQKVLDYYQDDEEKLRAAEFLIQNLPYYHSYSEEDVAPHLKIHEYFGVRWYSVRQSIDSVMQKYGRYLPNTDNPIPDVLISPDYLIENIDWAFKVWKEQPWGKNVTFEDFCEYILPHRIKDETLKPWREKIYNQFNPYLDSVRHLPEAEDPLFVAQVLLDSVSKKAPRFSSILGYGPHIGPDLVDWVSGGCRELTDRLTYIFRAVGIPYGCDYMPLRGDNNVYHSWNFVIDKHGESHYMYQAKKIQKTEAFSNIRSKVYRQTYSLNTEEQNRIRGILEKAHPDFQYPCYLDVTRLYNEKQTHTFTIPYERILCEVGQDEMVYLCHTSHMEWVPIAFSYPDKQGVTFLDVQGPVVFSLAVYRDETIIPITEAFELEPMTGNIRYFLPSDTLEEVKLLNKYHQFHESFPQRMIGGTFEGSDYADFRVVDTLHTITEAPLRLHNVVHLPQGRSYRYVRYRGPANSYCNVSEVTFYSSSTDTIGLKGRIIGTPNGGQSNKDHDFTNVYDGNPSTSFNYDHPDGGWAGLDLEHNYPIRRIVYTARNRENYIRKGDLYELFYIAEGQWHSAGKQIPESDSLLYTVPHGVILYLKNHSGGVDERIFDYHNGGQRYW